MPIKHQIYIVLDCSFFKRVVPSYKPRSTAAATVKVPPTIAQSPVRKPVRVLDRSSRLMTFIGEISYVYVRVVWFEDGEELTYEKKTPGIPPRAWIFSL